MINFLKKSFSAAVLFLAATSAHADSFMAKVVDVRDPQTVVVERAGERLVVRLGGIRPADALRGYQFLRWTLDRSWVMLEAVPEEPGRYYVFRSPDGLFVNREYVARGFAEPTSRDTADVPDLRMTYLGESNPRRSADRSSNRSRSRASGASGEATKSKPRSRRGAR